MNGQTEAQITRLKLMKRRMYGRAKLDLLQVRPIGAEQGNCIQGALDPILDAILCSTIHAI